MLEIIALIALCRHNGRIVREKGRRSGGFIAITVILWFGLEILGAIIGVLVFDVTTNGDIPGGIYISALVFAALGALLSYLIARNAKPGPYLPPQPGPLQGATSLPSPHQITLTRDKSIYAMALNHSFMLNGFPIGELKNGQSTVFTTSLKQNLLTAHDVYGNPPKTFYFSIEQESPLEIHFKGGNFRPEKSVGLRPLTPFEVSQLTMPSYISYGAAPPFGGPQYYQAPPQTGQAPGAFQQPGAVYQPPVPPNAPQQTNQPSPQPVPVVSNQPARFCGQCGSKLQEGALFCDNCGKPISKGQVPAQPPSEQPPSTL